MKKKLIKIILSVLILTLFWFLFIKKYDYQVNFNVKTSPGTVYSKIFELENWNITKRGKDITVINKTAFKSVDQLISLKDSTYQFHWELNPINDSITKVSVDVKDLKNSLKQRFLLLFGKSEFIKNTTKRIADFKLALERHLKKFRVKIVGKSTRPAYQSIIYVTFNSDLPGKAESMIQNVFHLTQYMRKNNIKKTGNPFMNIINLDVQNNKLTTEFCFPVEQLTEYPKDSVVKIRRNIRAQPALKAIFNGNYRYSDRAWFALINYANLHNIKIAYKPFEIYFNDPHNGEKELTWKADVYMPLKN